MLLLLAGEREREKKERNNTDRKQRVKDISRKYEREAAKILSLSPSLHAHTKKSRLIRKARS